MVVLAGSGKPLNSRFSCSLQNNLSSSLSHCGSRVGGDAFDDGEEVVFCTTTSKYFLENSSNKCFHGLYPMPRVPFIDSSCNDFNKGVNISSTNMRRGGNQANSSATDAQGPGRRSKVALVRVAVCWTIEITSSLFKPPFGLLFVSIV